MLPQLSGYGDLVLHFRIIYTRICHGAVEVSNAYSSVSVRGGQSLLNDYQ